MFTRHRPDGTRVPGLPPLRKIMPFIMPRRADAMVFFEQVFDLSATTAYLERWNADPSRPRLTLFHVYLAAVARTLHERPRLNRFIAGQRVYQRNAIELSVSVIKTKHDNAQLTVVKHAFDGTEGLAATRERVETLATTGRAAQKTASEKEVDLVTLLPRFVLNLLVRLQRFGDHWNLLPASLIRNDPLYASFMVTNLGSIGIDAAWHHLYEHGTLSIFAAMGKAQPMPFVNGDAVEVRPGLIVRYAFDERVADGFYAARSLDLLRDLVQSPWRLETEADNGPGPV
ncbi:MAG: 2-oxo acid dehydrogenase subunit E2 [Paracoccaceae bacterium]